MDKLQSVLFTAQYHPIIQLVLSRRHTPLPHQLRRIIAACLIEKKEDVDSFGNKTITHEINGKQNGESTKWYNNGQLYVQKFYIDGKKNGEYKEWHANGQLSVQTTYIDGNLNGEFKRWYANGQLWEQTLLYIDGNLNGEYKAWHNNEQLCVRTTYIDGKENGEYKSSHANGRCNQIILTEY